MKKEEVLVQFGKRVRQLRMERGWSQEELAYQAGFHRTYIGMMERGERNIALFNISKLANALGINVEVLFKNISNE